MPSRAGVFALGILKKTDVGDTASDPDSYDDSNCVVHGLFLLGKVQLWNGSSM